MATKSVVRSLSKSTPLLTSIPNIHRIAKALTGLTALSTFGSQISGPSTEQYTTSVIDSTTQSLLEVVGPAISHALPESVLPFNPSETLPAVEKLISESVKGTDSSSYLADLIELGLLLTTATYSALTKQSSSDKASTFKEVIIVHPIFLPPIPAGFDLKNIPNLRANLERASHAVWEYCYSEGATSQFKRVIDGINEDIREGVQQYNELLGENLDESCLFQIQAQHFVEVRDALDPITTRLRSLSTQQSKTSNVKSDIEACRKQLDCIQKETQSIGQKSGSIGDLVFSLPSYLALTFDKSTTKFLINHLGHLLSHDKASSTKYLAEISRRFKGDEWEEIRDEIERVIGPQVNPNEQRELLKIVRRSSRHLEEDLYKFHSDTSEETSCSIISPKKRRMSVPKSLLKGLDTGNVVSERTRNSISGTTTDDEASRESRRTDNGKKRDREAKRKEREEVAKRAQEEELRELEQAKKKREERDARRKQREEEDRRAQEDEQKEQEEAKRKHKEREDRRKQREEEIRKEQEEEAAEQARQRKKDTLRDERDRLTDRAESAGSSSGSKSVRFSSNNDPDLLSPISPISPRTGSPPSLHSRRYSIPGSLVSISDDESAAPGPSGSASGQRKRDKGKRKALSEPNPRRKENRDTRDEPTNHSGSELEESDRSQSDDSDPHQSDSGPSDDSSASDSSDISEFERFTPVKKVKSALGYHGEVGKSRVVAWNRVGSIGTRVCVERRIKDAQGRCFYTGRVEPGSGHTFSRSDRTNIEAMNPITETRDNKARIRRKSFDTDELQLGLVYWDIRQASKSLDILTLLRPSRQSYTVYPLTYVEVVFPDRDEPYVIPRRRLPQLLKMSAFDVAKEIYRRATKQEKAFTRAQGKRFQTPLLLGEDEENEETEFSRQQRERKIKRLKARNADVTDSESEREAITSRRSPSVPASQRSRRSPSVPASQRSRRNRSLPASQRRSASARAEDVEEEEEEEEEDYLEQDLEEDLEEYEEVPRARSRRSLSLPVSQRRSVSARSENSRATPVSSRSREIRSRDRSRSPQRERSRDLPRKRTATPRRSPRPRQSNTSKKRRAYY